jgi:N-formylglutamate deformylase
MELTQSSHLTKEAPPFAYDEAKAERLRKHLKDILEIIRQTAIKLGSK